jgi:ribulose-5-phosphate 4-epimerase/fuculose-1-phosphate aldolase
MGATDTDADTDIKRKIVTAIRMLESVELLDMNGHVSYRAPGTERVMINSRRASRAALTVADIVTIDLDGNLLEGADEPPSEYHIHTSIYRARDDVNAVLHNHPHWQTVLGIAGIAMEPVFSIGSFADPGTPVYEISSLVNTRQIGDELAAELGAAGVISLRHHGSVVVESDIEALFARAVFLEENAKKQYYVALLGPVKPMQGENLERTRTTNWSPKIARKVWNYHEEKARMGGKLPD